MATVTKTPPGPTQEDKARRGHAQRQRQAQLEREIHAAIAEIGPLPKVKNPRRKKKCRDSLLAFLTTYFPESTSKHPFSDDHQRVIQRLQYLAEHGGRFAQVVYRGFAKSTIAELATLWVLMTGRRKFAALFGAEGEAAKGMVDSIRSELEGNDLLAEDWPEVCYPFMRLEGKVQRCRGQLLAGQLTHIANAADEIVFPTVNKSVASGAVIRVKGLTAAGRGMKHKRPDGKQVRPDWIVIDDPQTDESAGSPNGIQKRRKIIRKSIMRMGGHQANPATIVIGTIIEPNDLLDQLSDHSLHPEFQSERIPLVRSFATAHDTFWLGEYAEARRNYDPTQPGDQERAHAKATKLYQGRRAEADAGCVVSWDYCYDENSELSAIQHAYNILIDDGPEVFASECQGEPRPDENLDLEQLSRQQLEPRIINLARGVVPLNSRVVTAFIDVQGSLLYWLVVAWRDGLAGHVVDYGTFPQQRQKAFILRDVRQTLGKAWPGADEMGAILHGLNAVDEAVLSREFRNEAGGIHRISRVLVDAAWGKSTKTVKQFVRRSPRAAILLASFGRGILAKHKPISEWSSQKKGKRGDELLVSNNEHGPHVLYDANYYKWRAWQGLMCDTTASHAITVFKGGRPDHQMLFDHWTSEIVQQIKSPDRTAPEFELRMDHLDNHFWDCLVGNCVAASLCGVRAQSDSGVPKRKTTRRTKRTSSQLNW